jgi:hypothetical protein
MKKLFWAMIRKVILLSLFIGITSCMGSTKSKPTFIPSKIITPTKTYDIHTKLDDITNINTFGNGRLTGIAYNPEHTLLLISSVRGVKVLSTINWEVIREIPINGIIDIK